MLTDPVFENTSWSKWIAQSAKTATADAILSYVRARRNSQGSANVETMYQLIDGKVEALEFIVRSETTFLI